MKKIDSIIVHISDSLFGSAREIRKWHLERGWKDIGYHFVILNGQILPAYFLSCLNGSIELGRPLDGDSFIEDNEIGAHCLGYNDHSVGICGIGKDSWQPGQIASLFMLLRALMRQFNVPVENVLGHCETESGKREGKICPCLDMNLIRKELEDL